MYTQTFLVTSVVGRVFAPQIAANASLSFFGAKRPMPFFFWANAIFFPLAFAAVLPNVRFCAVIFFSVLRDRRLRRRRGRNRRLLGRR